MNTGIDSINSAPNDNAFKSREARSDKNGRQQKPKHPKGLSWLFLVLAIVGIVHISYIFFWEYRQFKDRTLMLGKLEQSMTDLRAESELLTATLDHSLDLNYREQLARTQGFVYEDERLIVSPTASLVTSPSQ